MISQVAASEREEAQTGSVFKPASVAGPGLREARGFVAADLKGYKAVI